jgi:LSD1 subclass zinc finger protein
MEACYLDRTVLKCSECRTPLEMRGPTSVVCPKCDKEVDINDCAPPGVRKTHPQAFSDETPKKCT